MLKIENVHKSFKKKPVLQGIDMTLDNGIYGFLGPNGAGKTTLIRCITGSYELKEGSITLDDKFTSNTKDYAARLGYLPQNFGLFKDMKVGDALSYMGYLKGISKDVLKDSVTATLKAVNLDDRIGDKVGSLSGGMTRRLGIAQAIMGNPRLVILDEPTAGLDPEERIRFKRIIQSLEKDKIILISTHIASDVEAICDKVIVINKGNILFTGPIEELEEHGKKYEDESSSESLLEKGYLWMLNKR
ncbi:MAG: ATP-binding cassette domain-containing protein [Lachnospiraceae bacterium]|nr:ATP-binding cassette domain-containing protein [Lachnospiraceae bacterium]